MRQKDAKHSRLTRQIQLIELELGQLTCIEREQSKLHAEMQMVGFSKARVDMCKVRGFSILICNVASNNNYSSNLFDIFPTNITELSLHCVCYSNNRVFV